MSEASKRLKAEVRQVRLCV